MIRRFESDQSLKVARSLLQPCTRLSISLPIKVRVQSSTNKVAVNLLESSGISFTCTKNRNGPRTEPWGTPILAILADENELPMDTMYFLLRR